MTKAAFTVKAFGYYLLFLGVVLTFAPNLLLRLFAMPTTTEVWIRVVGIVVFNIGVSYVAAAKGEAAVLFHASAYTRCLVFVAFVTFAVLRLTSPMLVLFGTVDLAGAVWTYFALRSGSGDRNTREVSKPNPA